MKEENNLLITFHEPENIISKQVFQIKPISLSQIEQACETYNSDIDYLQVLARLIFLTTKIKNNEGENEFSL